MVQVVYGEFDITKYRDDRPVSTNVRRGPDEIRLRDYQQAAYDSTIQALRTKRSALIVLATGLGKTILFSKIAQSWPGRVLILVHLEELLQNAYTEVSGITGESVGIERADEHHFGERIVVATHQSLSLGLRRFEKNHFQLIIADEAHHTASNSYAKIFEHFASAKIVGVTATDTRSDKKRLPFDVLAYRMGIKEGIDGGYLVPVKGDKVYIDSIDLRRVRVSSGGDFDESELDSEVVKGAYAIADTIIEKYPFEKGILFFPGCASAQLVSDLLNKKVDGISVYVDGTIKGTERRKLIERLRMGKAQWFCNVGIATEGFNWPDANVVGMCAPTLSWSAYVQRVGRGTRPLSGIVDREKDADSRRMAIANSTKPWMTIVDFVGVSSGLSLITNESFNDQYINPVAKSANDESQLDRDDEAETEERKEKTVRVSFKQFAVGIVSKTRASTEEFDPFDPDGMPAEAVKLKGQAPVMSEDPSDRQIACLRKYGVDTYGLSRTRAQSMIRYISGRGWRLTNVERATLKKM